MSLEFFRSMFKWLKVTPWKTLTSRWRTGIIQLFTFSSFRLACFMVAVFVNACVIFWFASNKVCETVNLYKYYLNAPHFLNLICLLFKFVTQVYSNPFHPNDRNISGYYPDIVNNFSPNIRL